MTIINLFPQNAAHALTFLLPAEYRVILSALLSVALAIFLNLRKTAQTAGAVA